MYSLNTWSVSQNKNGIKPPVPSVVGLETYASVNFSNENNNKIYRINSRVPYATEEYIGKYGYLQSKLGTMLGS